MLPPLFTQSKGLIQKLNSIFFSAAPCDCPQVEVRSSGVAAEAQSQYLGVYRFVQSIEILYLQRFRDILLKTAFLFRRRVSSFERQFRTKNTKCTIYYIIYIQPKNSLKFKL